MTTRTTFRSALRRLHDILTAPAVSPDHAPWSYVRDYPVARPAQRRR